MSLHRFYLPPARCAGDLLRLDGREAHHALRVLRLKRGDAVTVLDGAGNQLACAVEDAGREALALRVMKKNFTAPPLCSFTLLVGVPRGKIIESIIQKSVELGARRVVPLLTGRVVTRLDAAARGQKHAQWRQVAVEAIKQCGAAWLPEIEAPATIGEFLARKEKFDLSLVGSLQNERRHPRDVFRDFEKQGGRLPQNAGVWIGPEGDFTPDELKAIEAAGALPITLGDLTLRVETAAIYCLSILRHETSR